MNSAAPNKILLYCWITQGFHVLVPKRRGAGYVRTPYGRHEDKGLARISTAARCDIYGLDGSLGFQCAGDVYFGGDQARKEFAGAVMPLLESHYGMKSLEILPNEFWAKNPVAGSLAVNRLEGKLQRALDRLPDSPEHERHI